MHPAPSWPQTGCSQEHSAGEKGVLPQRQGDERDVGLMDIAASSMLCKRTSVDWRKGYSGSFELDRSPGDYRAPGICTPSAF